MNIVMRKVSEIIPYIKNPRNNDPAVKFVANSIREFGFKVPIILDENDEIIAGHTRLKAAKSLGMDEVPTISADDLTPEQVKAFRLADNKTAELAEWDINLLDEELAGIEELDMTEFGFDIEHIEKSTPVDFPEYGEDIKTEYCCPKCGYEWSGKPK